MYPVKANPYGTYTYLFIMDPYIVGEDYDIESLVKKCTARSREANTISCSTMPLWRAKMLASELRNRRIKYSAYLIFQTSINLCRSYLHYGCYV